MINFQSIAVCALAPLLLIGCSTSGGPVGEAPSIEVADLQALPPPVASGFLDHARPMDVLSISVFGIEELSRELRVGQSGYIDFPLIGAVRADGRTLAEIGAEIEVRLAEGYVRDPDVLVQFDSRAGQLFTIGGEVTSPGQYPIARPTTLLEAVAIGGGRTDNAQLREVMIFRNVNEQRYIGVYDVAAIQRGNYDDPQIFPDDIVVVGESSSFRNIARIVPLISLITTPLILLERVAR